VDGGRSVDTSMGLTPLEGLMMGTRAGSIDPGIVFRLLRHGVAADAIEDDLEHRSGLVGVAGTQDVPELLAREAAGDAEASLALELFVRRAAAAIAGAATTLPSLDALVFTAGVGENAASIRRRICERLGGLGVPTPEDVDVARADASRADVAPADASANAHASPADAVLARRPDGPSVLRIHAREDVVIAEAAARLVARQR
jgi:acetate kinase